MKIKLYEPWFDEKEEQAVLATLRSKWWASGPKVVELEERIKAYTGAENAIAFNSATSAFHAVFSYFKGSGIRPIVLPSLTFISVAHSVLHAGHAITWRDVEPNGVHTLPGASKGNLVVSMDYAGVPCAYAKTDGMLVIDAAHSLGGHTTYEGLKTRVGAFGDATVFSFHAVKNISSGCGGMVTTSDVMLANYLRAARNFGYAKNAMDRQQDKEPWVRHCLFPGYNFYMNDIMATLAIEQLKKIDTILERRRALYETYADRLSGRVRFLEHPEGSGLHMFVVFVDAAIRNKTMAYLKTQGVETAVHYTPIHWQEPYCKRYPADLPHTDQAARTLISLPFHTGLTQEEVGYVCTALLDGLTAS